MHRTEEEGTGGKEIMEAEKKRRANPQETTLHFIEHIVKWQQRQQEVSGRNHYDEWFSWLSEFKELTAQADRIRGLEHNIRLYKEYVGSSKSFYDWLAEKKEHLL